ncbi:MAG: hypothetical protein V8S34_01125 [Lawsonibacter sp.]
MMLYHPRSAQTAPPPGTRPTGSLALAAAEHRGLSPRPRPLDRAEHGKPLFPGLPCSGSSISATAVPGPCAPCTAALWGWTSRPSAPTALASSSGCAPGRSGPGWTTERPVGRLRPAIGSPREPGQPASAERVVPPPSPRSASPGPLPGR